MISAINSSITLRETNLAGCPPFPIGNTSTLGGFSVAMLVYVSVHIFVSGYLQDIGNSERVLVFAEKNASWMILAAS